jgi:hypothetical protein
VQAVIVAKLDRLTLQRQRPVQASGALRETQTGADLGCGIFGHWFGRGVLGDHD